MGNYRRRFWPIYFGIILVGWGIFSIFNRRYQDLKFGRAVDLGQYYFELGVLSIIIGAFIIYLELRKNHD